LKWILLEHQSDIDKFFPKETFQRVLCIFEGQKIQSFLSQAFVDNFLSQKILYQDLLNSLLALVFAHLITSITTTPLRAINYNLVFFQCCKKCKDEFIFV